jgi:hypothetical protein
MYIENGKTIDPGANYFISLSPVTGYFKMLNPGYKEHITKKKITLTLHGEFEADR